MGCADPPSTAHPISVLSELVASYLCYFMLTCTHSDDSTYSSRYLDAVGKYMCIFLCASIAYHVQHCATTNAHTEEPKEGRIKPGCFWVSISFHFSLIACVIFFLGDGLMVGLAS